MGAAAARLAWRALLRGDCARPREGGRHGRAKASPACARIRTGVDDQRVIATVVHGGVLWPKLVAYDLRDLGRHQSLRVRARAHTIMMHRTPGADVFARPCPACQLVRRGGDRSSIPTNGISHGLSASGWARGVFHGSSACRHASASCICLVVPAPRSPGWPEAHPRRQQRYPP